MNEPARPRFFENPLESMNCQIANGIILKHDRANVRILAMGGYSAYLDDAGHPSDKPYLAVGGFIASEEQWIAFENPWKEILRFRNLKFPFHATDFFHEHQGDKKLKHIVSDLVRVITNHIEAAFSVIVDVEAYKALNRIKRVEEILGTPYALVTRALHDNVDK